MQTGTWLPLPARPLQPVCSPFCACQRAADGSFVTLSPRDICERLVGRSPMELQRGLAGLSRAGLHDPRAGLHDPRAGLRDPRAGLRDPRAGLHDPRAGLRDPRRHSTLWLSERPALWGSLGLTGQRPPRHGCTGKTVNLVCFPLATSKLSFWSPHLI